MRATEELVAAEHDDGDACVDAVAHQRLGDSGGGEIDKAAGAEIFDQRQVRALAQRGEFLEGGLLRESGDLKVGWMHAQQQARVFVDGAFVVGDAGAVGRAHFAQCCAAFGHDFGDAEAVADFDQLAARDDYFAAFGKSGENEQDRGGAVVDDDGGFGAGETLQ